MGFGVYIGTGGFYYWFELLEGLTSVELNKWLFKCGVVILCASDCDMVCSHSKDFGYVIFYVWFFCFFFGLLLPEIFESDIEIFWDVFEVYECDVFL